MKLFCLSKFIRGFFHIGYILYALKPIDIYVLALQKTKINFPISDSYQNTKLMGQLERGNTEPLATVTFCPIREIRIKIALKFQN